MHFLHEQRLLLEKVQPWSLVGSFLFFLFKGENTVLLVVCGIKGPVLLPWMV